MTLQKEDLPIFTPGRHSMTLMPPLQYAVYNIYYGGAKPVLKLVSYRYINLLICTRHPAGNMSAPD